MSVAKILRFPLIRLAHPTGCHQGGNFKQVRFLSQSNISYQKQSALEMMDNLQHWKLSKPSSNVVHIELDRPKVKNAFNLETGNELIKLLDHLESDGDIRCLVISGKGPDFTAGMDLKSMMELYSEVQEVDDQARKGKVLLSIIERFQAPFKHLHKFPKPIISVMHGLCLGLAMELGACCDIRYCTQDVRMSIREVLIGIAADVGSLQEMPRLTSNQSLLRELVYTGRDFSGNEAREIGYVSKVCDSKEEAISAALDTASLIAKRSPVAVQGSKRNLLFSRDHPLHVGLEYNAIWNMSMMQSEDVSKAISAIMMKDDNVEFGPY